MKITENPDGSVTINGEGCEFTLSEIQNAVTAHKRHNTEPKCVYFVNIKLIICYPVK